jgi:hypothetical protein
VGSGFIEYGSGSSISIQVNPDMDPDPAFQVNPDTDSDPIRIRIQGFDDQKLKEKNANENFFD